MKQFLFSVWIMIFCMTSPALAKTFEIYTGEWAPYVSEKMEGYGPIALIIDKAVKAAGHDVTIKFVPWKRAEVFVLKGKVVASFPWSPTEEIEESCFVSSAMVRQNMVFFYLKENLKSWDYTGLEDLKKYKIGGCPGYTYIEILENAGISIDYANDIELSMKKLIGKRFDLLPESLLVGKATIQKVAPEKADMIGISKTPLYSKSLHLIISKNHPDGKELFDVFEKGFSIIKENGTYETIIDTYGMAK